MLARAWRETVPGLWLAAFFYLLALLAATPTYADNIVSGIATAAAHVANIFLVLAAFNLVSWFIEAALLNAFLRVGYWKLFALSAVVNLVSTLLGLFVWPGVFEERGWKSALVLERWDRFAVLFLRSFLVTVAEEGLILLALLRARPRALLAGVVTANAATYVLAGLIMLVVR